MKMQNEQKNTNAGKRLGWLAAATGMLVIGICVTAALLASILKEHVTDDTDAIALVPTRIEGSAVNHVANNQNYTLSNMNLIFSKLKGNAGGVSTSNGASTGNGATTSSSAGESGSATTSQSTSQSTSQGTNSSSGNTQKTMGVIEEVVEVELHPDITVYDDTRTWETETRVDIFKITYENDEAVVTVDGMDDKVIAPGTGNEYTFYLKNTGDVDLDYTMEIEAFFSNESNPIPVEARLKGYDGNYLLGAEDSWADVLELNQVKDQADISVNRYAYYTLEWQWPYESGDDEYDTLLGNMAVNEELTLTIIIRTIATGESMTTEVQVVDRVTTGDSANFLLWIGLAVGAFIIMIMCLFIGKKRDDKEKEQENVNEKN